MKSRNQREGHYCGKNSGIPFIALKNTKNSHKLRRIDSARHQRQHEDLTEWLGDAPLVSSNNAWDRVMSKSSIHLK